MCVCVFERERERIILYLLLSQDAFILDTGAGGIFAWLGSGATQQEKKAAFKNAVVSFGPPTLI